MWIKREIEQTIADLAAQRPALILSGCRQVGKTALFQTIFSHYNYVSLDVPLVAELADQSAAQFLTQYHTPLIIDEVQYAPGLFRYLKQAIDQNRDKNGQYLLTGSQQFPLMQHASESLAGRVAVMNCYSLSTFELERWSNKIAQGQQLLEWIFTGGYPELHAKNLAPQRFYSDYLATYLERDVRQLIQVKNLRDFNRCLRLAALRSGQLLSYSSLASDVGVSPNTIKSWIAVLEASGIIYLLEPFYRNLGKRVVKAPKIYFMDTGLLCYLAGFRAVEELRDSSLLGSIFETHALGQLVRGYANKAQSPNIYFYRDHYGHEVDFVIPTGEKLRLIECKWSENPSRNVKGFTEIEKLIGRDNVLSKSIVTSVRGTFDTNLNNVFIEDSIEFSSIFNR